VYYTIDDNPTRQQIVMLLKKAEYMTVVEISREMGITSMAVRQHLMSLERKGLIRFEAKKYGIGRPVFIYRLTEKARNIFPNSYGSFLVDVLRIVEELDGRDKVDRIFRKRKQSLFEEKQKALSGARSFEEKVVRFSETLEKDGFLVELEEENGDFNLKQLNCLLLGVSSEYPEACRYEIELYRDLLGGGVSRSQCQREGDPFCAYIVPKA
jgi:predicted ArsR family transcriptional regulator